MTKVPLADALFVNVTSYPPLYSHDDLGEYACVVFKDQVDSTEWTGDILLRETSRIHQVIYTITGDRPEAVRERLRSQLSKILKENSHDST